MITINYLYKTKDGTWHEAQKEFSSCIQALRFAYGMQNNGNRVVGFMCSDNEDFEWLSYRLRLN